MKIGRRIYFEKETGNVILDTGEKQFGGKLTTIDYDFASYTVLKGRVREEVGVIELSYGQYAQDFAECSWYRVDPTTKTLRFSYPDPNAPAPAEPVYEKSLSEQIEETKQALAELTVYISTLNGGA